ncbi:peptide chain release factor N(5)-glutamine methyltransferase [Hydrogenovibrio sp. SC-1]|nr:peptide chain release factor N(5)-glutamine methyltransferase [Hydrogenovibrio sp. SC-1]
MRIDQALVHAKSKLSTSQSDTIALDAELLLGFVLNKSRTYLYTWPETLLTEAQHTQYEQLLAQRLAGKPIAYLTGERAFFGLDLYVSEATLIPRPDTEILVETALEKMAIKNDQAWSFCDLGTGSGAIACALKHQQPNCDATAIDFSQAALEVAQKNAQRHQLCISFKQGDWFQPVIDQSFDLIVSNPPYIESEDPHLNQGDVRFEPETALVSGSDGLEDIRKLIFQAPMHLKANGWLILEHGYQQAKPVQALFQQAGFRHIETRQDYGHRPRITLGQM